MSTNRTRLSMSHTSGARQMVLPSWVRFSPFRLFADLP